MLISFGNYVFQTLQKTDRRRPSDIAANRRDIGDDIQNLARSPVSSAHNRLFDTRYLSNEICNLGN